MSASNLVILEFFLFLAAGFVMCFGLDYFEVSRNWSACAGALVSSPWTVRRLTQ